MNGYADATGLATAPVDLRRPDDEAQLEAELADLIAALYTHHGGLSERIDRLAERAAAAGNDRYVLLAELTRADMYSRTQRAEEGARIAQNLLESATDPLVAAHAHVVISNALWRLGETGESANHAELAMRLLSDDDPLCLRAEHAVVFAIQVNGYRLGRNSLEWFQYAQRLADELASPGIIIANLNNWAWVHYERGELTEAVELIERMQQVADRSGEQLNASCVDTIARILLESGDAERATTVILAALEGFAAETDAAAIPSSLITLAEIQRRNGDLTSAIESLTSCREICVRSRIAEMGARALRELATCYAMTGDYKSAYEHMEAFHAEWTQLRSRQSEVSASVVQAVFGIEEARRRSREFQLLAEIDPLTGLWNRRKSDEHLGALLDMPSAERRPVTVAILDLDHFKQINDRFSHGVGDRVLRAVAEIFQEMAAPDGRAVRLGGEEFLLILPMEHAAAHERCERIRRRVAGYDWSALCAGLTVTTSVGATEMRVDDDYSSLLRRADQHLYMAKELGRDLVVADADTAEL